MLADAQTVEDLEPIRWPSIVLRYEDTSQELVEYKVYVRQPRTLTSFTDQLTIRVSQSSTSVTCSLEAVDAE